MTLGDERTGHPWLAALGAVVVASVLAMFALPGQEPSAFQRGHNAGTPLLPWLVLALIARTQSWTTWVVLAAGVVVFAVLLYLVTAVRAVTEIAGRADHGSTSDGRFQRGDRTLTAPRRVGQWQDIGGAITRRMTAEHERHWVDLDTYGQVLVEVPGLTEVDEELPLVLDLREAATVD